MALCRITGTVYLPDGTVAANRTVEFYKTAFNTVTADYLGAVVPEMIKVRLDKDGKIDQRLITGNYIGRVLDRNGQKLYEFKATVPEQAAAQFSDIIEAADPVLPLPVWLQDAWDARDEARAAEDAAEDAADRAETFGWRNKDTAAALIADTTMTTSNTPVGSGLHVNGVGDYVRVISGGDIITAGGVHFKVLPGPNGYPLPAFGVGPHNTPTENFIIFRDVVHKFRGTGSWIHFPPQDWEYQFSGSLPMWNGVSIYAVGARIREMSPSIGGIGDLFSFGNFHPALTAGFTRYPCSDISGPTNVVEVPGEGYRFSVGDQVFVTTDTIIPAGNNTSSTGGWLAYVVAVDGDELTLSHTIDMFDDGIGITLLADESMRYGVEAFFWDGEIFGGHWITPRTWSGDAATLGAKFTNLTLETKFAIWGNAWQYTTWDNCEFIFSEQIGEASYLSLSSTVQNCRFRYNGPTDQPNGFIDGWSTMEASRRIVFRDNEIDFGGVSNVDYLYRPTLSRDCEFRNVNISNAQTLNTLMLINTSEGDGLSEWVAHNNMWIGGTLTNVDSAAYLIQSNVGSYRYGCGIDGLNLGGMVPARIGRIINAAGASRSLPPTILRNMAIPPTTNGFLYPGTGGAGASVVDLMGTTLGADLTRDEYLSYITYGTGSASQQSRSGFAQRMSTGSITTGGGILLPVGTVVDTEGYYVIRAVIQPVGSNRDRALRFRIGTPAGAGVNTGFALSFPIADTARYELNGRIDMQGTGVIFTATMTNLSTGDVKSGSFTHGVSATNGNCLQIIQDGVDPGDTSFSILSLASRHVSRYELTGY